MDIERYEENGMFPEVGKNSSFYLFTEMNKVRGEQTNRQMFQCTMGKWRMTLLHLVEVQILKSLNDCGRTSFKVSRREGEK